VYTVTATRQGCVIANLDLPATDALAAIEQAERRLRLQARQYHISEKAGQSRLVEWTGYEFTARKVS